MVNHESWIKCWKHHLFLIFPGFGMVGKGRFKSYDDEKTIILLIRTRVDGQEEYAKPHLLLQLQLDLHVILHLGRNSCDHQCLETCWGAFYMCRRATSFCLVSFRLCEGVSHSHSQSHSVPSLPTAIANICCWKAQSSNRVHFWGWYCAAAAKLGRMSQGVRVMRVCAAVQSAPPPGHRPVPTKRQINQKEKNAICWKSVKVLFLAAVSNLSNGLRRKRQIWHSHILQWHFPPVHSCVGSALGCAASFSCQSNFDALALDFNLCSWAWLWCMKHTYLIYISWVFFVRYICKQKSSFIIGKPCSGEWTIMVFLKGIL